MTRITIRDRIFGTAEATVSGYSYYRQTYSWGRIHSGMTAFWYAATDWFSSRWS